MVNDRSTHSRTSAAGSGGAILRISRRIAARSPGRPAPVTELTATASTCPSVDRGEMLLGLGSPALIGSDDEQDGGRGPRASEHVRDVTLVPGNVDEGHIGVGVAIAIAAAERHPAESEIYGHPAADLVGPPIGFHSGQRPHQRGLTVIDMTGGRNHVHDDGLAPGCVDLRVDVTVNLTASLSG